MRTLRGLIYLVLIMGLLAISGCGSGVIPFHTSPGDNIVDPAGGNASQTFDGAEVVLVTAAVSVLLLFVCAGLAIYLVYY